MLNVCPCTWTFNFRFNLEEDMYSEDSIKVLKNAGADFDKHATHGIDADEFGSLLITSGLVTSDDAFWISFHSGYDFAYLTKIMLPQLLPNDEDEYRDLVKSFFPTIYDVKFMLRNAQNMARRGALGQSGTNFITNLGTKSGLQDIADELGCPRIGLAHNAGSDAWLTGTVFWQMKNKVFDGNLSDDFKGEMWGLTGVGPPASAAAQAMALAQHAGQVNAAANGVGSVQGTSGLTAGAMNFHTGLTPSTHARDAAGAPSTPTTNPAGLASQTPGPVNQGGFQPSMTPGGGGVFGNFQYAK
jgi:CCR4-NOT transcription complex subunit 7/8